MNVLRFLKTSVCLGFLALLCAPMPAASETPAAAAKSLCAYLCVAEFPSVDYTMEIDVF